MVDFAIIGVQKSGTTSLHRRLEGHPRLYMPGGEYAGLEHAIENGKRRVKRLEHEMTLLGRQAAANPESTIGFKRPNLFTRPDVLGLLVETFPKIKFVVSLRDPKQRTVAAYFHYVRGGLVQPQPVAVGIRAALRQHERNAGGRAKEIISLSLYGTHFAKVVEVVGRDRILFQDYAAALTLEGTTRVLEHIGLDPAAWKEPEEIRSARILPQKVNYSLTSLRLRKFVDGAKDRLSEDDRKELGRIANLAFVESGQSQPELPVDLDDELTALFAPEIEALEKLLERKFPSWKK